MDCHPGARRKHKRKWQGGSLSISTECRGPRAALHRGQGSLRPPGKSRKRLCLAFGRLRGPAWTTVPALAAGLPGPLGTQSYGRPGRPRSPPNALGWNWRPPQFGARPHEPCIYWLQKTPNAHPHPHRQPRQQGSSMSRPLVCGLGAPGSGTVWSTKTDAHTGHPHACAHSQGKNQDLSKHTPPHDAPATVISGTQTASRSAHESSARSFTENAPRSAR